MDKRVPAVDLGPQVRGVQVEAIAGDLVEGGIEDANYVAAVVVDDALFLLVPQYRDGGLAGLAWVVLLVDAVKRMRRLERRGWCRVQSTSPGCR